MFLIQLLRLVTVNLTYCSLLTAIITLSVYFPYFGKSWKHWNPGSVKRAHMGKQTHYLNVCYLVHIYKINN